MSPARQHRLGQRLLVVCGAYQIGVGVYFVFLRPSFLPEDLRFARISPGDLHAAAPAMEAWLQWVFMVLGGQMAGVGTLLLLIARQVAQKLVVKGQTLMMIIAGAFSVGTMSAVNFVIGSDFRWLLVAPVVAWALAAALLASATRDTK